MELTKEDNQMAKGVAIFGMVMLHLFCRGGVLPYEPQIYVGGTPVIYYLGLFGDLCVPTFCFCSGYAQLVLRKKEQHTYFQQNLIRLAKFLLNYWVVLITFSVIGLFFDKSGHIPGSAASFFGNFFLIRISYNGAWWFVLTYIILIALSPMIAKAVQCFPPQLIFLGSGFVYFISYLLRFVYVVEISNAALAWCYTQVCLLGTSQFPFVLGMQFQKHQIISELRTVPVSTLFRNIVCILIPVAMFLLHSVEESLIVAPITGLSTIVCFHIMNKPKVLCKATYFLGKHSTNIWLVHMFFYLTLFKDFVFIAKYPLLILLFMLVICIVVSYGINLIYQPAVKLLLRKVLVCQQSV